jgi:uncharacterized membrane protein YczE
MRNRLGRIAVAWPLVGLGIALLLDAELGVAPFDVENTGIADTFGWPFGVVYVTASVVFFVIGAALGGKVGVASVVGSFAIGPMIGPLRTIVPDTEALLPRTALMLAGTLVITVAVCLVISTELGAGPSEVFMLGLIHRGVPVVAARWTADGVPLLVGGLLGGDVGAGTVLMAFALGPMIKVGLRLLRYDPPTAAAELIPAP